MAKVCRNCGRKIGFSEKAYSLKCSGEYLCTDCGSKVMPLMDELKKDQDLNRYRQNLQALNNAIACSDLTDGTKRALDYEIEQIRLRIASSFATKISSGVTFEAGFDECCQMIISSADGEPVGEPLIVDFGDTQVVTFIFEQYFYRNGSYASLSVTLIFRGTRAIVTAIGSGGGEGVFNISWGAEEDYVLHFWQTLFSKYAQIEFEPYPVKTLEQMQHRAIGVLGGTFDPVHNGHIALARAALMQANLKKLIVMPAHVQPFKLGNEISDDHHRLEMAKLAFADMPEAEVSDYEIVHTEVSYTYDTLCSLKEMYPDDEIAFIMGTDSFLALDTWYMGRELLEQFSFLVSVRPGYRESELEDKIEEFRRLYDTNVEKLVMTMPDVSSTEIRTRYESGLSNAGNVPDLIERYIYEHGLYK